MKEIVYKHSLAARWFHWINFPVLGVMVWSGLLIYRANDVYKIGFGSTVLMPDFGKDEISKDKLNNMTSFLKFMRDWNSEK